ncbi:hypothetical protein [Amycolatopsis sp. NPDC051903]|uniref:hypothetical protein n=1 Tax=Amycolatopsis sp. NPDC051903 TaxID=3363936 RepID=UPI0037BD18A6
MAADTALHALVPDSSAIHAHDANFDGVRMVSGCTDEHLQQLVKQYRKRPFVDAELWAGKVQRAVLANTTRRIDDDALVEMTGLAVEQIHAGIDWHNDRTRALHERRDDSLSLRSSKPPPRSSSV